MEITSFIKQNREEWQQLEQLMKELGKSKKMLTPAKLELFQLSYQKAAHHLSFSQTFYPGEEVTTYLNELVSRAHNLLYRDQVTSFLQIKEFFGVTFRRMFLEQKGFIFLAAFLFLLGGIGGYLAVWSDPLNLYTVLPEQIARSVDPSQLGETGQAIDSPSLAAAIMTNNIQVAILAFVGGITLGIFTVYLLVNNGIMIGALAALYMQYGKSYDFWAYIVPHGIIELTAIFIAGGSGLLMAYRILVPGAYPRAVQLKIQALRSVRLLLGTIPLFIVAGIIEGYVTPAPIPLAAKYGFALLTVLALLLYLGTGKARTKQVPGSKASLRV